MPVKLIYWLSVPGNAEDNLEEQAASIARAVGQVLKKTRVEKGISKYRLARLAKLDERSITFVEEGTNIPTVENFARIALALSCRPSDLLREVEQSGDIE